MSRRLYTGAIEDLRFASRSTLVCTGWNALPKGRAIVRSDVVTSSLHPTLRLRGPILPSSARVVQVALMPGGHTLAQVVFYPAVPAQNHEEDSNKGVVRYELRDTRRGTLLWSRRAATDYSSGTWELAADGAHLALGTPDGAVRLFRRRAARWRVIPLLRPVQQDARGQQDSTKAIAFSHDSQMLLTCSSEGLMRFWNANSGKLARTLPRPFVTEKPSYYLFNRATLSPDNRLIATINGYSDYTFKDFEDLRVRRVATRKIRSLQALRVGTYITRLAFSPDGKQLVGGVSGNGDGSSVAAVLWNLRTGKQTRTLNLPRRTAFWGLRPLAWSPDGKFVVGGDSEGYLVRWNVR